MNKRPTTTPTRADAWRNAAFMALVIATLLLMIIKLFTGIVFMAALLVAVSAFVIAFAFIMRTTPR